MERMIFFNAGWMSAYDGIGTDKIVHGGAYIDKHGFGGEVYNFRNSDGKRYGYVMTNSGTLNLKRINLDLQFDSDVIENVTCVFVATHPMGGRRIVGWYQNANIYSHYQLYFGNDRKIMTSQEDWGSDSNQVGYFSSALSSDVVLLTEDERLDTPEVPAGKGGFGQSNVWYADSDAGIDFRHTVMEFISDYKKRKSKEAVAEQERQIKSNVDVAAKKKVELVAIKRTREYFENLGYVCRSVELENLGWDLEFTKGNVKLFVEVKGLSQSYISVLLSRNEYEKMRDNRDFYRLAVVTNCLDPNREPTINVFSFITEKDGWFDKYGRELNVEELVAARCELK
jgi:hypothetical protein